MSLKNRLARLGYRTIHKKDLNIKVSTGTFTFYFDFFLFMKDKNVCNYKKAEMYPVWWIKEPTWWEGNTIWLFRYDGDAA
jgi:hypothetical protein